MDFSERMILLRKELKLTQVEFGEKIGIARNTVANYEAGYRAPMEATLQAICRVYNVDYMWLTTGDGEMFTNLPETILDELIIEYDLDEADKRIIKAYLNLDDVQRSAFKAYMEAAFGKQSE